MDGENVMCAKPKIDLAYRILPSPWESRALARRGPIRITHEDHFQRELPSPAATASDSPEGRVKSKKSAMAVRHKRAERQRGKSQHRSGFSLLEVILTMAMSVVLMGLISWAFQFYTRDMNGAHLEIQQAQLASAILQMIEDDLRATLHPEPVDMSALESVLAAQAGGEQTGGGAGEEADLSAAGISEPELTETELETPDLTTGTAILQIPGLIGNQNQIQIDVSRLPRLEEYTQMLDQDTANIDDVPSDVKTVTYFVQAPGAGVVDPLDAIDTPTSNSANELTGGLVRRALDRNVTQYASEIGNLNQLAQTGQLLAPEVTSLQFQYWDGIIWQLEWSSDEYEELPLAIRIDLSMADPSALAAGTSLDDENAIRTFSHIVRLPMAKIIEEEEESEEALGTAP
jgi:type II secretory pathway pseudopilin PulG